MLYVFITLILSGFSRILGPELLKIILGPKLPGEKKILRYECFAKQSLGISGMKH